LRCVCLRAPSSRPPAREDDDLHVTSRLRLNLKQAADLRLNLKQAADFFSLGLVCLGCLLAWFRLAFRGVFVPSSPSGVWRPLYIGSLEAVGEIRNRVGLLCYRVRHVSNLFLTWS
jgi:hypothetical protein